MPNCASAAAKRRSQATASAHRRRCSCRRWRRWSACPAARGRPARPAPSHCSRAPPCRSANTSRELGDVRSGGERGAFTAHDARRAAPDRARSPRNGWQGPPHRAVTAFWRSGRASTSSASSPSRLSCRPSSAIGAAPTSSRPADDAVGAAGTRPSGQGRRRTQPRSLPVGRPKAPAEHRSGQASRATSRRSRPELGTLPRPIHVAVQLRCH